jgi:hypothetical protein
MIDEQVHTAIIPAGVRQTPTQPSLYLKRLANWVWVVVRTAGRVYRIQPAIEIDAFCYAAQQTWCEHGTSNRGVGSGWW